MVLFIGAFVLMYYYSIKRLEESVQTQKDLIAAEARNLIAYFDLAMQVHERSVAIRMRNVSDSLVNHYLKDVTHPEQVDLFAISRKMGLDSNHEHIYLVDQDFRIVNTTFPPDIQLNLLRLNPHFKAFFKRLYAQQHFEADRFGTEVKTGRIKKYAYQPARSGQYMVELGFYSKEADAFRSLLLGQVQALSHRYPGIGKIKLFLGMTGVKDPLVDDELMTSYLKCLQTKRSQSQLIENSNTSVKQSVDLVYLHMPNAEMYDGYVLQITSNNAREANLFTELVSYSGAMLLLTCIILSLIVYTRAKHITRPIKELSVRTQAISRFNLKEKLTISGSRELYILSRNFNFMVDKLRLAYEGLEEKVRRRTDELKTQKELIEQKNMEIIDSINYARFIQQAILTPISTIQDHFPESFVYYQPKDIVAGDFYWFEQRGSVSWFAVGDCTGHGVPGAMMSVLCVNALNQALFEKECEMPGELLNHVRDSITRTLIKEQKGINDGMDISIACYDHHTKQLYWSGANNPLWIFREDRCEMLRPDKQPVGYFEHEKPFNTHAVKLHKDDLIVLFTDGFADQFGGPKQKKFKYAPFRELIERNAKVKLNELYNILQTTFNDWKGGNEQTDDVCLMAIRINEEPSMPYGYDVWLGPAGYGGNEGNQFV